MENLYLKNWDRKNGLHNLNKPNKSNKSNYLHNLNNSRKKIILLSLSNAYGLLLSGEAFAGHSGNLPFVSTMNMLKESISGPFLLAGAIIMIVATCLMLAFGEWGEGFKRMINVVLWLSVAFAATSFVTAMFGSGAVF